MSETTTLALALSWCSRPVDGRACEVCLSRVERLVGEVERAGLVIVRADDLDEAIKTYFEMYDICAGPDASAGDSGDACPPECGVARRLRAAIPDRTKGEADA